MYYSLVAFCFSEGIVAELQKEKGRGDLDPEVKTDLNQVDIEEVGRETEGEVVPDLRSVAEGKGTLETADLTAEKGNGIIEGL